MRSSSRFDSSNLNILHCVKLSPTTWINTSPILTLHLSNKILIKDLFTSNFILTETTNNLFAYKYFYVSSTACSVCPFCNKWSCSILFPRSHLLPQVMYYRWDPHWGGLCQVWRVLWADSVSGKEDPGFSAPIVRQGCETPFLWCNHISLYRLPLALEVLFLRSRCLVLTWWADKRIINMRDLFGSGDLIIMRFSWILYQRLVWGSCPT